MSVHILTLFDVEPIVPDKKPAPVKKRAPKKEKVSEEIKDIEEPVKNTEPGFPSKKKKNSDTTEKSYYSIGETAAMFKVRTSHIRFWTVQFSLKMRTTRKGDRLYTPENIEQLRVIHHLVKEQGFTIAGAKMKLKELKNVNLEDLQKNDIIGILKSLRSTLISLKNQILKTV